MGSDEERLDGLLHDMLEGNGGGRGGSGLDALKRMNQDGETIPAEEILAERPPLTESDLEKVEPNGNKTSRRETSIDPLKVMGMSEEELDRLLEGNASEGEAAGTGDGSSNSSGEGKKKGLRGIWKKEGKKKKEKKPKKGKKEETPEGMEAAEEEAVKVPEIPEAAMPEVPEIPETAIPKVPEIPETAIPEVPEIPEAAMPEVPEIPEAAMPEVPEIPETAIPEVPEIPEETEKEAEEGKKKKDSKEKKEKESFGKRVASALFGSDEDELTEDVPADSPDGGDTEDAKKSGKADAKKDKKAKKGKKDKKEKKGPDPKKAANEKKKREKNAEKARKRAEKAQKAAEEKRSEKKLPKKAVAVWLILCASIAAGVLLINSVGMNMVNIIEGRNAFYDKDFETAYKHFHGRDLGEEDKLCFEQSAAVLHLRHANEIYENHLKLGKPVEALEDLLQGAKRYRGLIEEGRTDLLIPEAEAEYQKILDTLQTNYGLSEAAAYEIIDIKDDYDYSVQLEALVNGEMYQSETTEAPEESAATEGMEDLLPEEEEYLNDSSN